MHPGHMRHPPSTGLEADDMGNPVHMTGPLLTGIYEIDTASDPTHPALMHHVVGQVYHLCKSQGGSRFVQQRLDHGDEMSFKIFFDEILPHVSELMMVRTFLLDSPLLL